MANENKDFPIGAGNWLRIHPEDIPKPPYTHWTFHQNTQRMPEFTAPGLGKQSNRVVIEVEIDHLVSGVLYALDGNSGGLTLYMNKGYLMYEYNMMIIKPYTAKTSTSLEAGKYSLVIDTEISRPGAPGTVIIAVNGQKPAEADLKRTVPLTFTAPETLAIGMDLGSPVSTKYADDRPFVFQGKIHSVKVVLNP